MTHAEQIVLGEQREATDGWSLVASCAHDLDEGETHEEGQGFRSCGCDVCGSMLAGDMQCAALIKAGTDEEALSLDVCVCCLLYIANGDLCDCK